jgi:membrane-bound metal-dependent hydrolase YbcI (DUF457 family)
MPFTPFHFGPGVLLKALGPRWISLTAFVASQVAIDLESGYHLFRGDWPVHRIAHTLPVATLVGIVVAILIYLIGRKVTASSHLVVESANKVGPVLAGGVLGGLSHPVLDGIMHTDIRPLLPFDSSNPFLGIVDLETLHLSCIASGLLGGAILGVRCIARNFTEQR